MTKTTWITICETCKREDWAERGQPKTDGEVFAAEIIAAAAGVEGVKTRTHPCLMGCSHACNVAIQSEGKLNYTLGGFENAMGEAEGIVEYARLHSQSDSGAVPYRQWPQAIKGHFITRHPPLPDTTE